MNNGRFSILNFYVKRIKRILPAYLALIAFVLAITPFCFSVNSAKSISTTALYSIAYSANIYFFKVINYFDLDARSNPLLHLWSLGVEEQFYLAIPVCVWLLWITRKNSITINLIGLFIFSFFTSVLTINHNHEQFAFFMLPSRAWELLAGAILSQIPKPLNLEAIHAKLGAWLGLLLVFPPYGLYNDNTTFPGIAATPSILGAFLLIRYGKVGVPGKILTCAPSVWVGKVSYSLYLWHWPIFVALGSSSSVKRATAGVIGSFLAAFLSWRFVELPVRNYKAFSARHAFTMLGVCSIILAGACFLILRTESKLGEFTEKLHGINSWAIFEKARDNRRSVCQLEDLQSENKELILRIGSSKSTPNFALWGDSHALAVLSAVDSVAAEYGQAGYYINLKHNFTLKRNIGAFSYNPIEDREPVFR